MTTCASGTCALVLVEQKELILELRDVFSEFAQIAHPNRITLTALYPIPSGSSRRSRDFNNVLNIADVDAISRDAVTIDFKFQIRFSDDAIRDNVGGAGDLAQTK